MKKKQVMAVLLSMILAAGMMTGCGAQKVESAASQTQETVLEPGEISHF